MRPQEATFLNPERENARSELPERGQSASVLGKGSYVMEFQTLGPRKEQKARKGSWNQGEEVIRMRRKNLGLGARISVFREENLDPCRNSQV